MEMCYDVVVTFYCYLKVNIKQNFSQNRIQITLKHLQKYIFCIIKLCQTISLSPDFCVKVKGAKQDNGLY